MAAAAHTQKAVMLSPDACPDLQITAQQCWLVQTLQIVSSKLDGACGCLHSDCA